MISVQSSTSADGDLHLVGGSDVFDDGVNGLQSDVVTEGLQHKINHP